MSPKPVLEGSATYGPNRQTILIAQFTLNGPEFCFRTVCAFHKLSCSPSFTIRVFLSSESSMGDLGLLPSGPNGRPQAAQQSKIVFAQTTMSEIHGHAEERPILILYTMETWNSLDTAERIALEARRWHFHTRLASTNAYPLVSRVPKDHLISTFSPPNCPGKT